MKLVYRAEEARLDESGADSQLVERSLAGDAHAFADLCERHRERIWRIVTSAAGGPDAEDLVQEAVIRAFLSLKSYRRSAPVTAWLSKIALNASHDYLRTGWKRRVLLFERPPMEPSGSPTEEAERREMARRVRRSVSCLPEKMRTPIWLHYFDEFSIAEVAALEGTSESTVRARIKSGLERLSIALRDYLGAPEGVSMALETKECNT